MPLKLQINYTTVQIVYTDARVNLSVSSLELDSCTTCVPSIEWNIPIELICVFLLCSADRWASPMSVFSIQRIETIMVFLIELACNKTSDVFALWVQPPLQHMNVLAGRDATTAHDSRPAHGLSVKSLLTRLTDKPAGSTLVSNED